jgi:hypothetical protein
MKNVNSSPHGCNRQAVASILTRRLLFGAIFMVGVLISSCQKQGADQPAGEILSSNAQMSDATVLENYTGLAPQTMWELQQARAATARYRHLDNAIKDGYTDINVVVQGMGHHFMKTDYVDDKFDFRKPEILVYNKHEDGSFELVAVEYAIPLTLSTNAPAGFTGNNDVWDKNTGFGLWLLHAWVWSFNPNGVFNSTNPLVHTH